MILLGSHDVRDTDNRVMLAMAARTLRVLTTALLEGDDLLAAVVLDHFGLDGSALDEGSTDRSVGAFADNEDFGEFNRIASG